VKSETVIDLPRPRDPSIVLSPEFIGLKQRLLAEIEEESRKTFAQEERAS
jgi:hypothetical protein